MPAETVLAVEGLEHVYPNGVAALREVSLAICAGEYVAIVGQNGSGKTTLAKHFNGLLAPTRGRVLVNGQDIAGRRVSELSRAVGYVFQNPDDMLFCASVEEEIAFGPRVQGGQPEEIQARVEQILVALGLDGLRDQHPFSLSLGDRQRLAVACALSLDPQVFVFDEPTTGQDYFGGQSIMKLIDALHAGGKTIVIITHDMQMVAEHAQRVVVMNQGRVALDATPSEAFRQLDLLEKLSLRPPQVTQLAHRLGYDREAVLTVAQMCARLCPGTEE
jgi:energy-coupling factor transport system ATP-binding protein